MTTEVPPALDHLNLGCGLNAPPGWLNVDGSWQAILARHRWLKQLLVILRFLPKSQASIPWGTNIMRLDLRQTLPFATNSFSAVYSSHTLEHLHHADARKLLQECRRILKPGGICRIVVPDLDIMTRRYFERKNKGDTSAANQLMQELLVHEKEPRPGPIGIYYRLTAYHQHKWMYDADSLKEAMVGSGFVKVEKRACFDSRISRIKEVEDPARILNGEGVVIEGVKPDGS